MWVLLYGRSIDIYFVEKPNTGVSQSLQLLQFRYGEANGSRHLFHPK